MGAGELARAPKAKVRPFPEILHAHDGIFDAFDFTAQNIFMKTASTWGAYGFHVLLPCP